MDVEHLAIDDPRWPDALRRLHHDFYHLPGYVRLDGEWNQAQPMAFLARSGDEELFIPYLLRRCESFGPESMAFRHISHRTGGRGTAPRGSNGRMAEFAR